MKVLDKRTTGDLIKLLIFIVVTTLATSVLVMTIGNISFAPKNEYHAEFVDATGVVKGDDIRIAGVKVGTVKGVEIVDRTRALVTFTVEETSSLSGATHAAIRYRNLVGQRYIALTDEIGDTDPLEDGDTIPVTQTSPALDLTVLFNGFKPLFQALSPEDINQLSFEIVQVFQGEGGTLEGLLSHTASVTSTLASRDQVIGQLIDNLNEVLDHIGDRDVQLSRLITTFRTFVGGLAEDREAILGALDDVSELSVRDRVPGQRHPRAVRRGRRAAAPAGRQPRRGPRRDRPRPPGAADQAQQGRPHRGVRLLVQLLPVPLPGPGPGPGRPVRARRLQHRQRQV